MDEMKFVRSCMLRRSVFIKQWWYQILVLRWLLSFYLVLRGNQLGCMGWDLYDHSGLTVSHGH